MLINLNYFFAIFFTIKDSILLLSNSVTVTSKPSTVIFSPSVGSCSEWLKNNPPTVAMSLSLSSKPKNSSKSSISVLPSTLHWPGPILLIPKNLWSCSSGKSPTNSERTSLIVMTPSIHHSHQWHRQNLLYFLLRYLELTKL